MTSSRRRFLELGAVASIGSIASTYGVAAEQSDGGDGDRNGNGGDGGDGGDEPEVALTVRQEPGNAFYWVLPGPRPLSPMVFGTEENPRNGTDLLQARIEQARQMPSPLDEAIPQLLEDLPFLVAAPDEAREPIEESGEDSIAQQVLTEPTLYSNEAEVTSGSFEITYEDHQPYDLPGAPGDTADTIDLDAEFTDPAGNEYEIEHDHVVQPPIPGYETGGGVLTDGLLHGITGTGSPLFPKAYTYGASWGVGHVNINGERATTDGMRVIHFMTTQTVRNEQYRMAVDEEMPLEPENTIAGKIHHTHGVVLPIKPTPEGPVFAPVPTAFELPNGETQPFIHAMWEQEELVDGPFADWNFPGAEGDQAAEEGGDDAAQADVRLVGEASAWQGEAPDDISGTENPTLTLEEGTEYTLVWENGDGLQHNFAIEDENGEDVLATDLMREQGATQTVTFTASTEMAEYYCQVHPSSMRGDLEIQ